MSYEKITKVVCDRCGKVQEYPESDSGARNLPAVWDAYGHRAGDLCEDCAKYWGETCAAFLDGMAGINSAK